MSRSHTGQRIDHVSASGARPRAAAMPLVARLRQLASVEHLDRAAQRMLDEGAQLLHLLGPVQHGLDKGELDAWLVSMPVPVVGALFPAIICDDVVADDQFILIGHPETSGVLTVEYRDGRCVFHGELGRGGGEQLFVAYVDASSDPSAFVRSLFDRIGYGHRVVGGGAGSLEAAEIPCVITPHGVLSGAGVVVGLPVPARTGIAHGWAAIGDPLMATSSSGSVIETIDWRPAAEVYRERLAALDQIPADDTDLDTLGQRFPLIMERYGRAGLVRDVLTARPDGALVCAGDVRAHCQLALATASDDDLIRSVQDARRALDAETPFLPELRLLYDCVSRAMLLGGAIGRELAYRSVDGEHQVGALTIGELACAPDGSLALHNRTAVLANLGAAQ